MALRFELNGSPVDVAGLSPRTTLLQYLRNEAKLPGTKEGCAEGDCGACTVVVLDPDAPGGPALRAINSCLVLLPMLAGRRVWTVEGLAGDRLHPAQQAMVDALGSQCGFCTPGIVMSLVEATYRTDLDAAWKLEDQLCGNLCRCTGYRPIREAAESVAGSCPDDRLAAALAQPGTSPGAVTYLTPAESYQRPDSLAALWRALAERPLARVVCGATDLGLEVTKRRATFADLVDVSAVPELVGIEAIDAGWSIGAAVRLSDLETWAEAKLPPIARILRFFGARQIKHQGTIGGNLCNASPIGDLPPVLLALGARVVLGSGAGLRTLPLDDFFLDYRQTALQAGEVLVRVEVPAIPDDARVGAYKVSKRRELDISTVAAGLWVRVVDGSVIDARLAYGGMAATPARASAAEAALIGQRWEEATVERAVIALAGDFQPLDDHRGSAWYRTTLAANLLRAFFHETASNRLPTLPDRPTGTVLQEGT